MNTWFAKLAAGLTLLVATSGLALAQANDPRRRQGCGATCCAEYVEY